MKYLVTNKRHLRSIELVTIDGKHFVKYKKTNQVECGKRVNYQSDESKLGDFMEWEDRCKVCEKRYNTIKEEIAKLKK